MSGRASKIDPVLAVEDMIKDPDFAAALIRQIAASVQHKKLDAAAQSIRTKRSESELRMTALMLHTLAAMISP